MSLAPYPPLVSLFIDTPAHIISLYLAIKGESRTPGGLSSKGSWAVQRQESIFHFWRQKTLGDGIMGLLDLMVLRICENLIFRLFAPRYLCNFLGPLWSVVANHPPTL